MRIFQIYPEFQIFDLPDFLFWIWPPSNEWFPKFVYKYFPDFFWSGHSHLCIIDAGNIHTMDINTSTHPPSHIGGDGWVGGGGGW